MSGVPFVVRSPAKINWCLRVHGKRQDGFHEISSLVSAVSLADTLTFSDLDRPGVEIICNRPEVPTDERNLIVRAANLLASQAGLVSRLSCRITKQIPIGGGLGGGSSNGACTLMALNRKWGLNWPVERLAPLAAELGSDVCFFLWGGSAAMTGRGEGIRPVTLRWDGWIVLVLPAFSTSTADVYRAWRPAGTPVPHTMMDEIMAGTAPRTCAAVDWMNAAYNMLEEPAMTVCPPLRSLMAAGSEWAGRPVRLSGSGSTLFTAFDTRIEADQFARRVRERLGTAAEVVQMEPPMRAASDSARAAYGGSDSPSSAAGVSVVSTFGSQHEGGTDGDH